MRQINFRVWDGAKMHQVGDLTFFKNGSYNVNGELPVNDPEMQKFGGERYFLMQFTGLLDKNGKEIYEGDIVKLAGENAIPTEVKWMDGAFRVEQIDFRETMQEINPHHGAWVELYVERNGVEVIGNIHENPELLK